MTNLPRCRHQEPLGADGVGMCGGQSEGWGSSRTSFSLSLSGRAGGGEGKLVSGSPPSALGNRLRGGPETAPNHLASSAPETLVEHGQASHCSDDSQDWRSGLPVTGAGGVDRVLLVVSSRAQGFSWRDSGDTSCAPGRAPRVQSPAVSCR